MFDEWWIVRDLFKAPCYLNIVENLVCGVKEGSGLESRGRKNIEINKHKFILCKVL